jgi:hypothetical protein
VGNSEVVPAVLGIRKEAWIQLGWAILHTLYG